tara:strand:- start:438 stop:2291 length:1854 start_codon:yes stop_codon:yes gene_type:complete
MNTAPDTSPGTAPDITYTQPEKLIEDYASRGLVVLSPDDLGVPAGLHQTIFDKERAAFRAGERVGPANVPEIMDLLAAPGLVAACNTLVGEHWAIVPFTHNTPFLSGAVDQHWHKDDNGPFNGRKQRHHHAVQVEMLYYPQHVLPDMGPTATVPYSQYCTFNHEENHDSFAGADHLDFAYHISGMEGKPISGPKSGYAMEDIVARRTPHDERMRNAVLDLEWPVNRPFEPAPLKAGSVVLYSHNLLHRGNHRRDDWETWKHNPRFMWRFWLFRTHEPARATAVAMPEWRGADELTGVDRDEATEDLRAVWRYQDRWLRGSRIAPEPDSRQVAELGSQLLATEDSGEPLRVGAAYRLGALGADLALPVLREALWHERENVRRAATYGLVTVGEAATDVFLAAAEDRLRWVRKAGAFGLGETGRLTDEVRAALGARLRDDSSVYVRSVAASALGCLGRRAVAADVRQLVPAITADLLDSLDVEENRLGMDRAQRRSIKFVRPTDACDVCEGIGIDYGKDRFDPVRSAVRENALWSLVMLCSHGVDALGDTLPRAIASFGDIARSDRNIFNVGFALDCLRRLAHLPGGDPALAAEVDALLANLPLQPWDTLGRSAEVTVA